MSFCRTQKEDVADALVFLAFQMEILARDMRLLGGTAAEKASELEGAAKIVLDWEKEIRIGCIGETKVDGENENRF